MIAYSGPLPVPRTRAAVPPSSFARLRIPSQHHQPPPPPFLLSDDDEADEDDPDYYQDFELLDSLEDVHMGSYQNQAAAKMPPSDGVSKKSLRSPLSTPVVKKSVRLVPKSPLKGELEISSRGPAFRKWESFKPLNHGLSELSLSTWEERAYEFIRNKKLRESMNAAQISSEKGGKEVEPVSLLKQSEVRGKNTGSVYQVAGLELDKKCQPLVEYLLSLGLDEEHLRKIARKRKACLYVNLTKVMERLDYLKSLGVRAEDLTRIILRHPRVLEYTVERMMKPRVKYLQSIGVPDGKLRRTVTGTPSLLQCSLERSMKPRVRFLVEEVGINAADVWKVVVLSPQVLTQSIDESLRPRLNYLLKTVGMSQDGVAKMIMKHPQLLHYSIKCGIEPRIEFLRSIGLSDLEVIKVLTRSSQILSLSVEKSLKPKCDYLTEELKCGVQAITSFPAYFSLSLEHRIQPRHKFLKVLNKLPQGPFPMNLLAVTDQEFCEKWAKSTVEEYKAFRQTVLLHGFAEKFTRKNSLQYDSKR